MHQALLVDEILRHVFSFSSEDGRSALISVARSCQAWKDPALDYIWVRLSSVVPLLQLIPGIALENGVYALQRPVSVDEMTTFHSYARRVKHISHKQLIRVRIDVLDLIAMEKDSLGMNTAGVLRRLQTVQISSKSCDALRTPLGMSSELQQLDMDLGFKAQSSRPVDSMSEYLDHVAAFSFQLQRVSIRGIGSRRLNENVSSLTNLHVICLRMGSSLLPETLKAVMSFPLLSELEVHAGHFELDSLAELFRHQEDITFPSLRILRLRAHISVTELILQHLQTHTLHSMRLEAEDASPSSNVWDPIFNVISEKASDTLHSLIIEHHYEPQDLELDDNNITSPNLNQNDTYNIRIVERTETRISLRSLQILRRLRLLRHLTFDTTLPLDLCDQDIDTLVSWWPMLEHLGLGITPDGDEVAKEVPRITSVSLFSFARSLPNLKSLIIPLSMDNFLSAKVTSSSQSLTPLERVTLGYPCTQDPLQVAQFLKTLFPALEHVDTPYEQDTTRSSLQDALCRLKFRAA